MLLTQLKLKLIKPNYLISLCYFDMLPSLITTLSEPLASISPTPSTMILHDELQILFLTVPLLIEDDMVDELPLTLMS